MTAINKYESARKAIMRLIRTANTASKEAKTLEQKITMQRLSKKLSLMDLDLKKSFYDIEDAIELTDKAEFCDKCEQQV